LGTAPALAFDCTALTGATIPKSAIGLPTSGAVVESASFVVDPVTGTYCKLSGGIKPVDPSAPDIKFQVNLPEHWNGKMLQFGGGGMNGIVATGVRLYLFAPAKPQPLARGYVTFGSDSGHQGKVNETGFALNSEALFNFSGAHLKKTHDTALVLVRRAYHARPRRSYFAGGSTGGREALLAGERWPHDYDGIISVFPAYNMTAQLTARTLLAQEVLGKPGAWLPPAKLAHLSAKVLEACDALDGLKDGIIGNVKACRTAFDIAVLRCPGGADTGSDCFSDTQIASMRQLSAPIKLGVSLSGVDAYAPSPFLESGDASLTAFVGDKGDISDFRDGLIGQGIRFIVLQDANADVMKFDPTQHAQRLQTLSRQMDVTGALVPFSKRGGKLLMLYGTSDMTIPPGNTIAFYERLQAAHGAKLASFARLYDMPGLPHGAQTGNFQGWADWLGALDFWVTKGMAPGRQTATDLNEATAGRTRPVCEYPAYPKYDGSGDVNRAASFTCAMP
jgi:hypothetical protein